MDVLLESLSDLADGLQKPLVALKGLVGLQKALERLSNKVEIVIDHILAGQNAQNTLIQHSPSMERRLNWLAFNKGTAYAEF